MVLHMPWNRNLGAARVQLELAEEFEKLGHHVEKFDCEDAFGKMTPGFRFTRYFRSSFSARAVSYVRRHAKRFDIVDALEGSLPASKEALGFEGLLAARSVGLGAFYEQFELYQQKRWPSKRNWKGMVRTMLERPSQGRASRERAACFEAADVIFLPNKDELDYVSASSGFGRKCRVLPFGLTKARLSQFIAARRPAAERLRNKQAVFVGSWGARKGSKDWSAIIEAVRQSVPGATFLFLGAGWNAETVLKDLSPSAGAAVRVVPSFQGEELPLLLRDATAGAFPSYIEGFPFAVMEKLAAGLPTVAYDVPGPRAMLGDLEGGYLVNRGDTSAFAARLVKILTSDAASYQRQSDSASARAAEFSWEEIARETLSAYESASRRAP